MEDYYEIIGTNRAVIFHMALGKTNNELDEFLQGKYEYTIGLLEIKKKTIKLRLNECINEQNGNTIKSIENNEKIITLQTELEKLNQQMERVTNAYEQVKNSSLRASYFQRLEEFKQQQIVTKTPSKPRKKTAYEVLKVFSDSLKSRTDEENDEVIRNHKEMLINMWLKELESSSSFSTRAKIELKMKEIEESYLLIDTADKREKYDRHLQEETEKCDRQLQEEARKQELGKKYSHVSEYDPTLISNRIKSNTQFIDNKMVVRKESKYPQEFTYLNGANKEVKIKETAVILFRNSIGVDLYVNEYEIKRIINGEEKVDIIYTDLCIADLSVDQITGRPIKPNYYNCVMNQLLSEDIIEGVKGNGGYVGEIIQDAEGNYHTTIGNEKLNPMEKEKLTAVIMMKKKKEKAKEYNGGKDK